jgi:hypothetical protein
VFVSFLCNRARQMTDSRAKQKSTSRLQRRAIDSSWSEMTGQATVILAEGWPAFQNA